MNASNLRLLAMLLLPLALLACDDNTAGGGEDELEEDAAVSPCPDGSDPEQEICNESDDDCDGLVDEGFNLVQDVRNCGACGNRCSNTETCEGSVCIPLGCPPGRVDADGDSSNGCEAECAERPGPEACNEIDDDCDGSVDEDFATDITNCGSCGNLCAYTNGSAACDSGSCVLDRCDAGWADRDGDPDNGCEAECERAASAFEICNTLDDDCDGLVDEDFDLEADVAHCGACRAACRYPNGVAACEAGECQLTACEAGFADGDGRAENGCERACEPSGDEICDDVDNDCDGRTDEGFIGTNSHCGRCGRVCEPANAEGTCEAGRCTISACEQGFADVDQDVENGCEAACEATGDEVCDEVDNDCDGRIDEGFDTLRDTDHCGGCGQVCETGDAEPGCSAGRCVIRRCPDGFVDQDGNLANGCEYECTPSNSGREICDGVDNDCDMGIDEGFDLMGSLDHCGGCGERCEVAGALAACTDGVCEIALCEGGLYDANGDVEDGCEYACEPSGGGVETCDEVDNDCDGAIDEGYDTQTDASHCGACGTQCFFPNGVVTCEAGACVRQDCEAGWVDLDGEAPNGCEYACRVQGDGTEACNQRDDDCDGAVDEDFDLMGNLDNCGACGAVCRGFESVEETACVEGRCTIAECAAGTANLDGQVQNGCESGCVPSNGGTELCNGEDEDCDGRIDETFDFDEDPDNCGGCGEICDAEGGAASCVGGRCIVQGCDPGFVDLDRDPANGCECPLQNGGVELCNGEDDDCNGVVDDPGTVRVPVDFRCLERGVCVGVRPVCRDAAWSCDYPAATYEADETRCDDLDNDCDGRLDEAQPEKGDPCFDGMGACQVEGTLVCTDDLAGTECDAVARMATGETCNGIDDDCDGNEDEGVVGTLVTVPADGPRAAFQIMAYEASRPDAAADDAGRNLDRACSNGGVLPWAAVGFDDAQAACRASGMELCTREEWRAACAGAAGQTYPYGDAYEADTCNGRDAGNGAAIPGGAAAECRRDFGGEPVYDLSGNVWEWVSGLPPVDPGDPAPPADARVIRGGGYGNVDGGLTCDFEFFSRDVSQRDNLGFRCCRPVE